MDTETIKFACVFIFAMQFIWIVWKFDDLEQDNGRICKPFGQPIDAVYTWVNGSDPDFIRELKKYKVTSEPARFEDYNQLLFSLRSLELYAPWIRHVYIVTNGQIPDWLDYDSNYVTIVTHSEIYPNKSHLPTFSSPSIETHLHRIINLSNTFIYFNDDMALIEKTCPSDFIDEEYGLKLYFFGILHGYPSEQSIYSLKCPNKCDALMDNNKCDSECNLLGCLYDGDDCDGADIPEVFDNGTTFYQSIDFTNLVLNIRLNLDNRFRQWVPHMPYPFQKNIMEELQEKLRKEYEITSSHRIRQKNDIQASFAFQHYVAELEKSIIYEGHSYHTYIFLNDDNMMTKTKLQNVVKPNFVLPYRTRRFSLCVNDGMDPSQPDNKRTRKLLNQWYMELYPFPSQFEKEHSQCLNFSNSIPMQPMLYDYRSENNTQFASASNRYDNAKIIVSEKTWLKTLIFKSIIFMLLSLIAIQIIQMIVRKRFIVKRFPNIRYVPLPHID